MPLIFALCLPALFAVLAACVGTPPPEATPAWQLAGRLAVGMSKNQVNKAMRWLEHRGRSYRTHSGTYEDWIYSPAQPKERVHLRFFRGKLISIGVNQKPQPHNPK